MKNTFWAKLDGIGKLDFGGTLNQVRWLEFCKKHHGKYVKIEKPKSVRSIQQNRFYWLYLHLIQEETGNLADDLHEYFKRKLLPPKFIKIKVKGKLQEIKIPASTTELSKLEFGEYLDRIGAESGVAVPDPKALADFIPNY